MIVLLIVLLLSLCACGDDVVDSTAESTAANVVQSLTLGYYKDGGPKYVTDYDLKQLLKYDEIHNLVLANYIGTDLSILAQVKGLRTLRLMSMEDVTDLSFLASLTDLKSLMIYDLSDEFTDISVLSQLTWLESLWVNNIGVDDFSPLYSLTQLKVLDLTSTAITQSQYNALLAALPGCEIRNVTVYN